MSTNAPASSYIVISSIMATFCTFGWVVIFVPDWEWYLIPVACAVPAIAVLALRWTRRRRLKHDVRATLADLG